MLTNFTSSKQWSSGTTCTAAGGSMLSPNYQTGAPSSYTATTGAAGAGGSWFPGTPCSVNVTGSGCYLAWSNATHYYEEGNYNLSTLNYLPNCPTCSRAAPATADGQCSGDGSLSCTASKVNYRCIAVLSSSSSALAPTPTPTSSLKTSGARRGSPSNAASAVAAVAAAVFTAAAAAGLLASIDDAGAH